MPHLSPDQDQRIADLLDTLSSGDLESRCRAILDLGRSRSRQVYLSLRRIAHELEPPLDFFARVAMDRLRGSARASSAPADRESILRRLRSPFAEERIQAVLEVELDQDRGSIPRLLEAIEEESNLPVIAVLVRALTAMQAPELKDRLLLYLEHHDEDVRAMALEGFWASSDRELILSTPLPEGQPGGREGLYLLVLRTMVGDDEAQRRTREILSGQDEYPQLAIIYALASVQTPWAAETLASITCDPRHSWMLKALVREIVDLRHPLLDASPATHSSPRETPPGIATPLTRQFPAILTAEDSKVALRDPDPIRRLQAVQRIRQCSPAEFLPMVLDLLETEEHPVVLSAIPATLAVLGGREAGAPIRRLLLHEDPRVRSSALESITSILPPQDVGRIATGFLSDSEPRVRGTAASVLLKADPDRAMQVLEEILLGRERSAREDTLWILSRLRDESLITLFRRGLKDSRREVYHAVADCLAGMATQWAPAKELLQQYREGQVAGPLIEGEPVQALIDQMHGVRPADRIRALMLVWRSAHPRVRESIELNLSHKDPEVRSAADKALRGHIEEIAVPHLYMVLADTYHQLASAGNPIVPHRVREALEKVAYSHGPLSADRFQETARARSIRIGRFLYDCFDQDVVMDPVVRSICLEIRDSHEQIGRQPVPPEPRLAINRKLPAQVLAEGLSIESSSATGPLRLPGTALAIISVLAVLSFSVLLPDPAEHPGGTADSSRKQSKSEDILDAISLSQDPSQLSRFIGDLVSFEGKIERVRPEVGSMEIRSGGTVFTLEVTDNKSLSVPAGRIGVVQARISRIDGEGHVTLKGTIGSIR